MTSSLDFLKALRGTLSEERLELDVPLAPMTTFRIGGPADLLYRARTPTELADVVLAAKEAGVPYFLLGLSLIHI